MASLSKIVDLFRKAVRKETENDDPDPGELYRKGIERYQEQFAWELDTTVRNVLADPEEDSGVLINVSGDQAGKIVDEGNFVQREEFALKKTTPLPEVRWVGDLSTLSHDLQRLGNYMKDEPLSAKDIVGLADEIQKASDRANVLSSVAELERNSADNGGNHE